MTEKVFSLVIGVLMMLILLPLHEYAHAYMANRFGDPTAREQGRLTLNPIKHIDPIGAILMLTVHFGWGKPVPVDTRYFKNPKRDMAIVALAGPASNLIIAMVLVALQQVLVVVLAATNHLDAMLMPLFVLYNLAHVSIYLAIFNMLPIPPLDGSRLVEYLVPGGYYARIARYERIIRGVLLVLLLFTDVLTKPMSLAADFILDLMYRMAGWIPTLAATLMK